MKDKHNKKAILIAIIVASLVFAIGVIIAIILNNRGAGDGVDTSGQTMSTELKSGSVTTTIGGKSVTYSAAYVVDGVQATVSAGTYASATDDQNVFLVINGGSLKIEEGVEIKKSGSEGFSGRGDNYSFYGTNSAIVVVGEGSSALIDGVNISTTTSGANAVVATNGGEVLITNSEITTTEDNSRGLHATYKGEINADTVKISTLGKSSAALTTGEGEGIITAINMTLSTSGVDSPLIYSNGNNITVTNSEGSAKKTRTTVDGDTDSVNLEGCKF